MKVRCFLTGVLIAALCSIPFPLAAQATDDAKALFDRGEYVAAIRGLRELAAQGDAEVQYAIGSMYWTGRGVRKDYDEAVRWMRQAADQGFPLAQHNLGASYERGIGVERDDAEAVRWYRKAAEQGSFVSQATLGFIYANGRGPSHDLVEAYKWLLLAIEGLQGAERTAALECRDRVAKRMTPVQIAQADRIARNWRPKDGWGSPYSLGIHVASIPAGEASAVAAEQAIDMGSYSLRAPLGEGWSLVPDFVHGTATFLRNPPDGAPGWIVVTANVLRPEVVIATEQEMAATIQRFEEKSLWERGAMKSYAAGKVENEIEILGDKTLYVMRYTITDRSRGFPIEVRYATSVYLPPNVKQTRRVYVFTVGKIRHAGLSEEADVLPEAHPVISSLREQ